MNYSDVNMYVPYEGSFSDHWFREVKRIYEGRHARRNVAYDWDDWTDETVDYSDEEYID